MDSFRRSKNSALLGAFALAAWGGAFMDEALWGRRPVAPKEARKCLLEGCEVFTTHNGGYCCADHCREDRRKGRLLKSGSTCLQQAKGCQPEK